MDESVLFALQIEQEGNDYEKLRMMSTESEAKQWPKGMEYLNQGRRLMTTLLPHRHERQ